MARHGADEIPLEIERHGSGYRVKIGDRWMIADLVDVSTGTTDLTEETRKYLSALTEDVNIKVFTTPT